jgi:hypothetical protein
MAKKDNQKKEGQRSSKKSPAPDAGALFDMYKTAKLLATTATANAWGVLGGISGDATWSMWKHVESPFFSRAELLMFGYCASVAIYTLVMRTQTGVAKSLAFAGLMFADGQITKTEYEQIRKTCLKRAGLIGDI